MRFSLAAYLALFSWTSGMANTLPTNIKEAPRRLTQTTEVIVEETEIDEECEPLKICVQGQLFNRGGKAAEDVKLRVEIGGTKYTKPRITYLETVDTPTMNPGDREEFHIAIERKIPYKDRNEMKAIE